MLPVLTSTISETEVLASDSDFTQPALLKREDLDEWVESQLQGRLRTPVSFQKSSPASTTTIGLSLVHTIYFNYNYIRCASYFVNLCFVVILTVLSVFYSYLIV